MKHNYIIIPLLLLPFVWSCSSTIDDINKSENYDSIHNPQTKVSACPTIDYYGLSLVDTGEQPYRLDSLQNHFGAFVESSAGLESDRQLAPTHFALKIHVDDLDSFMSLEQDTTLIISYVPFGYTIAENNNTRSNKESSTYNDNPFSQSGIIEECKLVDDEDPDVEITPMYVFWPVLREIPSTLSYELLYLAYIPEYAKDHSSNTRSDEEELWLSQMFEAGDARDVEYGAYVYAYDNSLSTYVPVKYASVAIGGSRLNYVETDSNGYFALPSWISPQATNSLTLYCFNDTFTVRQGSTTSPVSASLGQISTLWANNNTINIYLPYSFELEVYQAASYYFWGSNSLLSQTTQYQSHINIQAINNSSSGYLGLFNYTSTPYIEIYCYYTTASFIFGTVLHELGHATHYQYHGQNTMASMPDFILESFASFHGWFCVFQYYVPSVTSHTSVNSICTQGRQTWTSNANNPYTPLYIDLYDNYDQSADYPNAVQDNIAYVPISAIVAASVGPVTYSQVYNILYSYVGSYYTSTQFSTFIQYFNCFN